MVVLVCPVLPKNAHERGSGALRLRSALVCIWFYRVGGPPPPVYKMYTDLLCLELLLQQLRFSSYSPLVKDLLGTDEAA